MSATPPPARHRVDTPRGPVAYEVWGSGPPLLLVAGLGSRARLWGELPRLLADRFTVIVPDNRGVGGSRGGEPFSLDGAAADVAAVVSAAGLTATAVLGASMGGLIATLAAATHPRSFSHLVAVSCAARLTPAHTRVLRFFELAVSRMSPPEAAEAFMAFAFGSAFADAYPAFVDQAARLWTLDAADLPGAHQQIAHLGTGWDLRPLAARIECPTLVVAGELDPIVPAAASRELAAAIPEARFREVPGAAHSVLAEGGSALLNEVIEFIQT